MAEREKTNWKFEEDLREEIAATLHSVKSYNLPEICTSLGLASGTEEEAFSSKRSYVKSRILGYSETALLELASAVISEVGSTDGLQDLLSEHAVPPHERISDITRRKILKSLDNLDELFGDLGKAVVRERLDTLAPMWNKASIYGKPFATLEDDFQQHYLLNSDWDNSKLLELCGALTCTQARFVTFLDSLLRPEARVGADQTNLVKTLGELLAADGYAVRQTSYVSGYPVYAIGRQMLGVAGAPKNLIFASTGAKPELVFRDAVNNDVEIAKHADLCLIYDRPLSSASGLSWLALAEWWQEAQGIAEIAAARRSLGERLLRSIPENSPGVYAIFRIYFEEFTKLLDESLPALVPQVYLHFDPLSQRLRGGNKVLARQRMDFLLLLPDRVRVVIEIDGQQHYATNRRASPQRYAEMMIEDRRLRLKGYELYRFGAAEFPDATSRSADPPNVGVQSRQAVKDFFTQLFARHQLLDAV